MKAIRRINNNVIICLDEENHEVIARGKGIGFHEFPYEIEIQKIDRTYYDIDSTYYEMIRDLPEEIIDISTRIVDKARESFDQLQDSNIVFTLADHINFAIRRYKDNLPLTLPIVYDIQFLLKDEYRIGMYGLQLIHKELNFYLPKDEAAYIALHIHEVVSAKNVDVKSEEEVIEEVTEIIEKIMEVHVSKEGFNYSRFVSHMYYLIRRKNTEMINALDDGSLYIKMKEEYPKIYLTAEAIASYLRKTLKQELNDEEKLYLMLHINRLCSRE